MPVNLFPKSRISFEKLKIKKSITKKKGISIFKMPKTDYVVKENELYTSLNPKERKVFQRW